MKINTILLTLLLTVPCTEDELYLQEETKKDLFEKLGINGKLNKSKLYHTNPQRKRNYRNQYFTNLQ